MSNSNAISWFEIYVDDMARARRFYETVLERTLEPLPTPEAVASMEMFAFPAGPESMQQYGANGALVKREGNPAGGSAVIVYFACEDCADAAARVESAGGQLHLAKQSLGPYGFMALALDTEGNMFGLHSMK